MSAINLRHKISHYLDVFYNKYYIPQIMFQRKQRKRIKNKDFTLLTGNCIGGYVYHQLGLEFRSPTINLMILNQDFKKLVLNLRHYMSLTPISYVDTRFPDVPSALLDDIVIHFTHYSTSEEGIKAWEKRKHRIDYNNVFVIISDIDLSVQDIEELRNAECRKLAVMTSKDLKFDHCLFIPKYKGMKHVGELLGKTISGKWRFEHFFDLVDWVNSEDKIAQHFYIGK